jgi:magnesium transporter
MRRELIRIDARQLRDLMANRGPAAAADAIALLTAEELAELLLQLDARDLTRLEPYLGKDRLADAIAELDPVEATQLLLRFSRDAAADILEEMEPDDATDVVGKLSAENAEDILREMQAADANEIRELMAYPEHTAGGRMTPEFISLSPGLTVAGALRVVRQRAKDAETVYYLYVTDEGGRLQGVVSLRDLVTADPQQRVGDIARRQVIHVPATADQEVAARLLTDHDLLALPVVDDETRLLGVVTADDVSDVLEEEATEDIEKLGGAQPLDVPYLQASVFRVAWKRIGWLLALFVAEAYTGSVLRYYENELQTVITLAFFIPLLIGTGGNVGSQITTTLVRAMAVGDVKMRDVFKVVWKEVRVSFIVGGFMAVATFIRAWTLGVGVGVQLVVAITAAAIVLWAALVAAALPIGLRRLRIDPAVVSAPFITTLVDGTGLIIYFTIALRVLGL